MLTIFDYTDYRKYLADYYRAKKSEKASFSYQVLALKVGFKNSGFMCNIVNGKKSLSRDNCLKIAHGLKFDRYETEYFEALVAFNQSKGFEEKKHFFEKLQKIKEQGKRFTKAQLLRQDQYEFYSVWYHSAVRSLIDMYGFKEDFVRLAKMLEPPITVKQARESFKLLKRLDLISLQEDTTWRATSKSITSGVETIGIAFQNVHIQYTDLAKRAIIKLPKDRRNISGLTLGISKKGYDRIIEETYQFQEQIMAIANDDQEADTVYQYNFHIFPMAKAALPDKEGPRNPEGEHHHENSAD